MPIATQSQYWLARLRGLLAPPQEGEYCELCNVALGPDHAHLVEPDNHWVLCACAGCAAVFTQSGEGRYRLVPTEVETLTRFHITGEQWDALQIPIDLAFFFYSSAVERMVALYPGPGGAGESVLDADAWQQLAAMNPVLDTLRPDVEAVLVNRTGGAHEYYRLPMDRCYALVETIRLRWRGLNGGAAVEEAIREFCAGLQDSGGPLWCHA